MATGAKSHKNGPILNSGLDLSKPKVEIFRRKRSTRHRNEFHLIGFFHPIFRYTGFNQVDTKMDPVPPFLSLSLSLSLSLVVPINFLCYEGQLAFILWAGPCLLEWRPLGR